MHRHPRDAIVSWPSFERRSSIIQVSQGGCLMMVRWSDTATCRVRSACGPIPQPMLLSGHVVRKHPARGLRDGDAPRLPPAASNHGVGAPGLNVIIRSGSRPGKSATPVPPVPRGLRPQGPFCNLFICMALPRMYREPAVPGHQAAAQRPVPQPGTVDPPPDGESTPPVVPCGTPSRHMGAEHRVVYRQQPLCSLPPDHVVSSLSCSYIVPSILNV